MIITSGMPSFSGSLSARSVKWECVDLKISENYLLHPFLIISPADTMAMAMTAAMLMEKTESHQVDHQPHRANP